MLGLIIVILKCTHTFNFHIVVNILDTNRTNLLFSKRNGNINRSNNKEFPACSTWVSGYTCAKLCANFDIFRQTVHVMWETFCLSAVCSILYTPHLTGPKSSDWSFRLVQHFSSLIKCDCSKWLISWFYYTLFYISQLIKPFSVIYFFYILRKVAILNRYVALCLVRFRLNTFGEIGDDVHLLD